MLTEVIYAQTHCGKLTNYCCLL